MPTAIALRSFDHNGKVRKGDTVTFDRVTMDALRRSGLVSKDTAEDPKPLHTDGVTEIPKEGTYLLDKGEKVVKPVVEGARRPGKKSAASQAAPASLLPTAKPSAPGALPPPPPVK
jgi:hypothetical protein